MVGVGIAGLILSLVHLGECALVQYGVIDREIPTTIVFEYEAQDDPITVWFKTIETALQTFQKNYLIYDTNFNPDKKYTVPIGEDVIGDIKDFNPIETVLGGRFGDPIPPNTRILPGSAESQTSLSNITEFIKKQSFLHKEKGSSKEKEHDFKLIFKPNSPSPIYVDLASARMLDSKSTLIKDDEKLQRTRRSLASLMAKHRVRRDTILNVPIPIAQPFYSGTDETFNDKCSRNMVEMEDDFDKDDDDDENKKRQWRSYDDTDDDDDDDDDDECYEVLSRGPCDETEIVLMNPETKKGICGPRLCSPDRVFLWGDQLCHDPHEKGICPNGMQLYSTGFGTPICGCEDGFYEHEVQDDSDEDEYDTICQPLLTEIPGCRPGKVFWFDTFRNPPSCVDDPCRGLNLNRKYSELPYAPAIEDGNCYQIGSSPDICEDGEFFSLDLPNLRGVCQSLDEAGYLTLDSNTFRKYEELYGSPLSKDSPSRPLPLPYKPKHSGYNKSWNSKPSYPGTIPAIGTPVVRPVYRNNNPPAPLMIGQSVVGPRSRPNSSEQPMMTMVPTHTTAYSPPYISIAGNVTVNVYGEKPSFDPWYSSKSRSAPKSQLIPGDDSSKPSRRRFRRAPLPHATPGSVFEPALSSCRAGAVRDINQKCRATILPSRSPHSRPRRATGAVRPFPGCPSGSIRNLQRSCTTSFNSVQSSIIARGLG